MSVETTTLKPLDPVSRARQHTVRMRRVFLGFLIAATPYALAVTFQ